MAASRVALGGVWGTLAHTGLPSKGVKSDSFSAEDTEVPLGKTGGGVQNFLLGMATSRKAAERGPLESRTLQPSVGTGVHGGRSRGGRPCLLQSSLALGLSPQG